MNWSDVKLLMEKYLGNLDIDVYICLDSKREAEGIEKIMLDNFNSSDLSDLGKIIKLSKSQIDNLLANMPYNRFWKIKDTKSIGLKSYANIFNYFYNLANHKKEYNQISFFDLYVSEK